MAIVTSNEYDHIDVVNGSNTNRHYIKDTTARNSIENLKNTLNQKATIDALQTETNRAKAEEARIEALFTVPTQEAVDNWLDEHPEATTTVQDGSLTEDKFADALKLQTIKDYVTPEMYGAKGNGSNDDTSAIQSAIDSGKSVFFPAGTYKTFDTIHVNNKTRFVIDASQAMIDYMGEGYALEFKACRNCNFNFGYIYARNGGGLNFVADNTNTWSQYINVEFDIINVLTNGINASMTVGDQWINEFRIRKGRFQGGANALNIETVNGQVSGWHLTNVAFEGVTNGVNIVCTAGYVTGFTFLNCRYAESFTTIMKTSGEVTGILIIGSNPIKSSWFQLSDKTSGHIVSRFARTSGTGLSGSTGEILNGKLFKTNGTDNLTVPSTTAGPDYDLNNLDSLEAPKYLSINSANISKLILPTYYGAKNGFNDFYLVFTKNVATDNTFDIEQNGAIIKSFSSRKGTIIHAVWIETAGWKYFAQTSV